MKYTQGLNRKWNEWKKANPRLATSIRSVELEAFAKQWYLTGYMDATVEIAKK